MSSWPRGFRLQAEGSGGRSTSIWLETFRKSPRLTLERVVDFDDVLRHGLDVLHYDRDYDVIARVSTLRSRRVKV